jgi:uncharacterized membrane protein
LTFSLLLLFLGREGRGQGTRPNLLRNGDFEKVAAGEPAGWTKSGSGTWSVEPGRFGNRCLKLTAATQKQEKAEIRASSSGFPVTPGKHYLLVFWAEGEGLKQAEGISSQVYWEFQRPNGSGIPTLEEWKTTVFESSCEGRWNVGHLVVKAPAEAASARLIAWLGTYQSGKNGSVYFDHLQITEYHPPTPEGATWFYRSATYGVGGDQVDDPQTRTGQAWKATVKKHRPGGKISGPLIMDQEPGLYRAVFRIKVADRTSPNRLAFLRITGDGLASTWLTAGRSVTAADFAQPNQYQEFTLEFIRSPFGGVQFLVDWYGGTDMWLDGVTVHEERLLSDLDLARLYGLDAGPAVAPPIGRKAYVCQGLNAGLWRFDEALAFSKTPTVTVAWLTSGAGDLLKMSPSFPQRSEELSDTRLVVLSDVHAQSLGFMGRKVLRDFVAVGGGLLVVGGFHSFGHGGLERTLLEDVLPVRVLRTFDLAPCQPPSCLKPANASLFPTGIPWSQSPQCLWLHRVEVKPGGKVLIKAGEDPFLVAGHYGKGRVAVCLGTVLGKAPQDAHPFWQWHEWPQIMSEVINYLKQQGRDW